MDYGLLYVVCRNRKESSKIAAQLLSKRIIACANIVPSIDSVFRWKGKIRRQKESLLLCKIRKKDFSKAAKEIEACHSYSIPCIALLDIDGLNNAYGGWLASEIGKKK